jgi:hypothetical protein
VEKKGKFLGGLQAVSDIVSIRLLNILEDLETGYPEKIEIVEG